MWTFAFVALWRIVIHGFWAIVVDQEVVFVADPVAFVDTFITGRALTGVLGLEAHFMPFVAHVGCHSSSASRSDILRWCGNGLSDPGSHQFHWP